MNKAKYDSLPPELKSVLDANSGQVAASMAGTMWDNEGVAVADTVKQRGNTVTTLSREEAARWRKATEPVIEAWHKQMKDRGADSGKLLETARALLAKYETA
jgi:TRAP-type C4-dicarboxylate transport system substrate-binding protein